MAFQVPIGELSKLHYFCLDLGNPVVNKCMHYFCRNHGPTCAIYSSHHSNSFTICITRWLSQNWKDMPWHSSHGCYYVSITKVCMCTTSHLHYT